MGEPKFTSGPYTLCDRGDYADFDGNSRVILGDDDTIRLAVVQTDGREEFEANAHLFATAPELFTNGLKLANEVGGLRAFKDEVVAVIGHTNWNVLMGRLDALDAALAKARGEQL
jgi:hypothetical protein